MCQRVEARLYIRVLDRCFGVWRMSIVRNRVVGWDISGDRLGFIFFRQFHGRIFSTCSVCFKPHFCLVSQSTVVRSFFFPRFEIRVNDSLLFLCFEAWTSHIQALATCKAFKMSEINHQVVLLEQKSFLQWKTVSLITSRIRTKVFCFALNRNKSRSKLTLMKAWSFWCGHTTFLKSCKKAVRFMLCRIQHRIFLLWRKTTTGIFSYTLKDFLFHKRHIDPNCAKSLSTQNIFKNHRMQQLLAHHLRLLSTFKEWLKIYQTNNTLPMIYVLGMESVKQQVLFPFFTRWKEGLVSKRSYVHEMVRLFKHHSNMRLKEKAFLQLSRSFSNISGTLEGCASVFTHEYGKRLFLCHQCFRVWAGFFLKSKDLRSRLNFLLSKAKRNLLLQFIESWIIELNRPILCDICFPYDLQRQLLNSLAETLNGAASILSGVQNDICHCLNLADCTVHWTFKTILLKGFDFLSQLEHIVLGIHSFSTFHIRLNTEIDQDTSDWSAPTTPPAVLREIVNFLEIFECLIQDSSTQYNNDILIIQRGTKQFLILWKQFQDAMQDASKLRRTLRITESEMDFVRRDLVDTLKANQDLRNSLLRRESILSPTSPNQELKLLERPGIDFSARQKAVLSSFSGQDLVVDV